MKSSNFRLPKNWALIALTNLLVAAVFGFILRYKMNYPSATNNYNHFLHAHSHFVFHAWAGLAFMCSFIQFLLPKEKSQKRAYAWIFWSMMFTSVGMLISFSIQSYGFYSILFSTLAQVVYYWFIIQFIRDSRNVIENKTVRLFAYSALATLFLSTIGPYFLAYYSAKGYPALYANSSLYFYLHFQYNGWFTFAMLSLFFNWLHHKKLILQPRYLRWVALLFVIGVLPAYSFSLIGSIPHPWIVANAYFAVITKIIAVALLCIILYKIRKELSRILHPTIKLLWFLAALALVLKTAMEVCVLDAKLVSFAFSYRPLIIGYLHLIFLVMLSFFLFGYFFEKKLLSFQNNKLSLYGMWSFVALTIASEVFLFLQAFSAFFIIEIPHLPILLFYVAALTVLALVMFVVSQVRAMYNVVGTE